MQKIFIAGAVWVLLGLGLGQNSRLPGTPLIVAAKSITNQTGAIPPTTIFTVKTDGIYRIAVYEPQAISAVGAGPEIQLNWTDEFGTEQAGGDGASAFPVLNATGSQGASTGGQLVVHCLPGSAIQISDIVGPGQPSYSVYVTVELL